ncbi:MAG: hypothetical protein AB1611_03600 [bacterium]
MKQVKKRVPLLSLLAAAVVVTGVVVLCGSSAFAQSDVENIIVNGTVAEYAQIDIVAQHMNFGAFTGQANQTIGPKNHSIFRVETNTIVNLEFKADDLAASNGQSTLQTKYLVQDEVSDLGYTNRDDTWAPVGALFSSQGACTVEDYSILGWARTGDQISDQQAGDYAAGITLTVSAL